jgi:hypothetical protein
MLKAIVIALGIVTLQSAVGANLTPVPIVSFRPGAALLQDRSDTQELRPGPLAPCQPDVSAKGRIIGVAGQGPVRLIRVKVLDGNCAGDVGLMSPSFLSPVAP